MTVDWRWDSQQGTHKSCELRRIKDMQGQPITRIIDRKATSWHGFNMSNSRTPKKERRFNCQTAIA